jgi:pilus assembly protein CpaF
VKTAYQHIHGLVMDAVKNGNIDPSADADIVRGQVAEIVRLYQRDAFASETRLALSKPTETVDRLVRAVCGLGELGDLIDDPQIEEIHVQGRRISYWTGDGDIGFLTHTPSEQQLMQYVRRILQTMATGDRELSAAKPVVTVGLSGGIGRLAVKIPPVVSELTVAIRKTVLKNPSLELLVERDMLTWPAARLLQTLMTFPSRVIVAGAPAAGKTTLMNALLHAVPPKRVVRVNEEDRELTAPLTLGGYATASDMPGQSLRDLIRADLRFRPELLVVGEVRGSEAYEVLRPLNAGCGFLTSLHCNSATQAVEALANAASLAFNGAVTDTTGLRRLFTPLIDVVVFCDADLHPDGSARLRPVTEIASVDGMTPEGDIIYQTLFDRAGGLGDELRWSGMVPRPDLAARIERALPARARLRDLLAGDRPSMPSEEMMRQ